MNKKSNRSPKKMPARVNEQINFRRLTETMPVMIYAAAPHPPYSPIYISPAFETFGYPLEQWYESLDLWVRILHEEDRARVLQETEAALKNDGETDMEYRIVAKDGTVRWVRDRGCFVRDEQGNALCWQGVIMDIGERKRAQQALSESEQRYRQMFEGNQAIKLLIDVESGAIIDANPAASRFYGYSREEFKNKKVTDLNTLPAEQVAREMKRAAAERRNYFIFRHRLASGEVRDVEVHSSPFQNENQNYLYSIIYDITERVQTEEALKASEARYRDLFENANDLIYTHDLEGNFTSLNRAGELITGYTREEVLRMNITDIVAPDFLEAARQMTRQKLRDNAPVIYELKIVAKHGHRVSLELSTRLIYDEDYKPVAVQGIARDITRRKQVEKALIKSEQNYRILSEGIMHQVWTATSDGRLDYVNQRTIEYFGRTAARTLKDGWQDKVHPDDLPASLRRWTRSLQTGEDYETEFRLQDKNGKYRWHSARATAELDANGSVVKWFGTNTDIDDRKMAEAKLSHYALHDGLTNLPNRAKFMHHLERSASRAEHNSSFCFAVLFLDLDRFKIINDSLGHSIGDKLLIAIAKRLEQCVRPGDIVARLGGDEFTVLLNSIHDISDAVRVANRFLEKLSEPFKLDTYEVFTSASIGIIVSDDIHRQPEDFLRDADTAMYRAKEAGKSRYEIFDREMHIRNMNLLQMENDLRRAIEQNEFRVFYQPIVALDTGEIQEFEALIRWQHPEHGLVMPNDFIEVAEETGLIIPIGEWVLRESCRQTAEWQKRISPAKSLSVSVNLSAKQLMHPHLTAQVSRILKQTALDSRHLKLEVTESMVMENSDKALTVISELNSLGIALSTDDFGTGYSSLSYLHKFPFSRLKIDRSFVSKMDADRKSEAIVRTILLLGQNLNIETVAEGIETETQLELLQALGCKTGQGFLFSKPVNAAAAAGLLEDGLRHVTGKPPYNYRETGKQFLELDKIQ